MSKSSTTSKIECFKVWLVNLPNFEKRKKEQIKKAKENARQSKSN